jgi:hypothetical protein
LRLGVLSQRLLRAALLLRGDLLPLSLEVGPHLGLCAIALDRLLALLGRDLVLQPTPLELGLRALLNYVSLALALPGLLGLSGRGQVRLGLRLLKAALSRQFAFVK